MNFNSCELQMCCTSMDFFHNAIFRRALSFQTGDMFRQCFPFDWITKKPGTLSVIHHLVSIIQEQKDTHSHFSVFLRLHCFPNCLFAPSKHTDFSFLSLFTFTPKIIHCSDYFLPISFCSAQQVCICVHSFTNHALLHYVTLSLISFT